MGKGHGGTSLCVFSGWRVRRGLPCQQMELYDLQQILIGAFKRPGFSYYQNRRDQKQG